MAKKKIIEDNQEEPNGSNSEFNSNEIEIDMNGTKSRRDGVRNRAGEKDSRDTIALILSIIFIAALGFFGYQYFNNTDVSLSDRLSNVINLGQNDDTGDTSSDSTIRGDEDRNGRVDETEDSVAGDSTGGPARSVYAEGQVWVANDYKQGDIDTGDYTVVQGDTLWEIAEAAYGDGTQWTRILEANSGSVGYLASGQQALIITGQTLVIPSL